MEMRNKIFVIYDLIYKNIYQNNLENGTRSYKIYKVKSLLLDRIFSFLKLFFMMAFQGHLLHSLLQFY